MMYDLQKIVTNGKKSLDELLKEKAYNDLESYLSDKGVDIEQLHHDELQALVQERVDRMKDTAKGAAIGGLVSALLFGF